MERGFIVRSDMTAVSFHPYNKNEKGRFKAPFQTVEKPNVIPRRALSITFYCPPWESPGRK